jgi:hypothetical protein
MIFEISPHKNIFGRFHKNIFGRFYTKMDNNGFQALAAWSSGIVSACHLEA